MSTHTPGPWKRGSCDSWIIWAPRYAATEWVPDGATLGEPETVVVAVVEARAWAMGGLDPDEREAWLAETDATSNLIAAAPEMLSALKALLERYHIMGCGDGPEALQAQHAINLAEGCK